MSISLDDLTPQQREIYETIMKKAESATTAQGSVADSAPSVPQDEQSAETPLEQRTIAPVHPEDGRRELDAMYDRLVEQAKAHGGKRETRAEISTPTNRQGIALDAVLSELTRVSKRYPELEPFIRRAMQIAHEGLTGASSGQGNSIVIPE